MTKYNKLPSKERLLTEFLYHKDGYLLRKNAQGEIISAPLGKDLYRPVVKIDGKTYSMTRIIYKMHHGIDPDICDHMDNNPCNNKIANIQSITHRENIQKGYDRKERTPFRFTKLVVSMLNAEDKLALEACAESHCLSINSYVRMRLMERMHSNKIKI